MATTVGAAALQVQTRARDPNQTATLTANVFDLLSRLQTIINGATRATIQSSSLVVPPNTRIFSLTTDVASAVRVVGVRDAFNRDLESISFDDLKYLDFEWFTETGGDLLGWTMFGSDTLILRPALTQQQTVTVFYQPIFAAMTAPTDAFTIPDEDVRMVLDGCEAILDLKARDFDVMKPILDRWLKNVGDAAKELR